MRTILPLLFGGAVAAFASAAAAQDVDWQKVDDAFGRKGRPVAESHRYGFPRTDLHVTVDGVVIKPAFALGSWIALKPVPGGAMAMGDLVLLETEINPVMSKLFEGGLEVTALHNHLLRANPPTFYMHVSGHGDPVKLATAIHAALSMSKTPLGAPAAAPAESKLDLDTAQIEQIIGLKGQADGGTFRIAVPRREPTIEHGIQIPPRSPGMTIALHFQPTGGGKAAITGDFVLLAEEVNPVAKTLRANGIEVTAIHSHMLSEQPRLIFMHFWANDDALKLAKGLRDALDKTASARS